MNVFIAIILVVTVLQFIVCKLSLWWLICLIARALFCLRIIGATFNVKKLCITEGVSCACMLLFHMVFSKGEIPWVKILLFALFCVFSCVMMFLDDILYVYVVEEDDDE